MENTFAFITNEYETQHFFFQNSAFLFPNFISPDGLTKKAEKKKMPIPHDGNRLFR